MLWYIKLVVGHKNEGVAAIYYAWIIINNAGIKLFNVLCTIYCNKAYSWFDIAVYLSE